MALQEFRPGFWLLEVQLEGFAVRGALLLGQKRAVVWDTLSRPRDMAPLLPLLGDREVVVLYSHADWDHIWGTAGLPGRGELVIGHTVARERFAKEAPAYLRRRQAEEPGNWDAVELVPPILTFSDELALDLGGSTLLVRHLPGHTLDSIVAFWPEGGILLAGDAVETPFPLTDADSPLEAWVRELRRWGEDPRVQTVVPAHGIVGGRELLPNNADYLQALLDGCPVEPPEPLDDFYREAHQKNLHGRQKD